MFYVTSTGSGNLDGSDWNNAYAGLPENLTRGATYFIADGDYGGYTFDDAEDGNKYITIKKAVSGGDHGTDVGWQDNMGDGQSCA